LRCWNEVVLTVKNNMNRLTPVFITFLLVSSTVACGKPDAPEKTSQGQTQAVPAGTTFEVSLPTEISTGKNKDQDSLVLPVKSPLVGGNPVLKGAKVEGHLENVVKAAKGRKAKLNLVFDEIVLKDGSSQPLEASLVDTKVESKTKGQFLKNVGIIAAGTVAGHFVGHKAGTKHGGMAGAAAATAFVLSSPGGELVRKKRTELDLKLKRSIEPAKAGI
jgi:hypothetical protein